MFFCIKFSMWFKSTHIWLTTSYSGWHLECLGGLGGVLSDMWRRTTKQISNLYRTVSQWKGLRGFKGRNSKLQHPQLSGYVFKCTFFENIDIWWLWVMSIKTTRQMQCVIYQKCMYRLSRISGFSAQINFTQILMVRHNKY